MNEKREKFKRLAEYRTNEILKKLDILGNCANTSNYEYTEKEVNKIFREINKKTRRVKAQFQSSVKKKSKNKFKL